MKREIKICLPAYRAVACAIFMVLLSFVRGVSMAEEIGPAIQPYLALLAAVIGADTCMSEWNGRRGEVFWMLPLKSRVRAVRCRLAAQTLYVWLLGAAGYWLFFWQRPLVQTGIIAEYAWYLAAAAATVMLWPLLAMSVSNVLRSQWAGIGVCIVLWLAFYSTRGEQLFGKFNVFAYVFCYPPSENTEWLCGSAVGIAAAAVLYALIPATLRRLRCVR